MFKTLKNDWENYNIIIQQLFKNSKKAIESIDTRAFKAEDLLKKNAQSSLAIELHNLYKQFRAGQRTYLTSMLSSHCNDE